jgi:hypothetical protein
MAWREGHFAGDVSTKGLDVGWDQGLSCYVAIPEGQCCRLKSCS